MSTPNPTNGRNEKQPPDSGRAFPMPKAVWAAANRDPEAVMALLWAVNRLLTRKRQPFPCYPGACAPAPSATRTLITEHRQPRTGPDALQRRPRNLS
jgi:hypothetical protein